MSRPLSMDDSTFPQIRRFKHNGEPLIAIDLGPTVSRLVSDAEVRRLRDALNADAAGEETVAHVTARELRSLSLQLVIGGEETPETLARRVMREVSNELAEMSERAAPEPPTWTAEPPECDCFWKPHRSGRNTPTSLRYRDGRYWTDQSSYSQGQMLYSGENGGRFLAIPGGIPVCPEVVA